jgi:hypothetical protein
VSGRFGVVYVSGLVGSFHGGIDSLSGVTRDCSAAKCVCSVSSFIWGLEAIALVCGTLTMAKLGCSLVLGYSPAIV